MIKRLVIRHQLPDPVPAVVAAACGYECVAITTGRFPTISALQRRHRVVAVLVLGWLAVHFARYPPTVTVEILPPAA